MAESEAPLPGAQGRRRPGRRPDRPLVGASAAVLGLFFSFACTAGRALDEWGTCGPLFDGAGRTAATVASFLALAALMTALFEMLLRGASMLADRLQKRRIGTPGSPCGASGGVGGRTDPKAPDASSNPLRRLWRWMMHDHPFAGAVIAIAFFWSFSLIGYAPGLFTLDTPIITRMWFNIPYVDAQTMALINPDNPTGVMTQHHPALYTALFGLCVQLGQALGSENLGAFICCAVQWSAGVLASAWAVCSLRMLGLPAPARAGALAFLCAVPLFAVYATVLTKDQLFAVSLLLLCVQALRLPRAKGHMPREWALLALGALGTAFLRSGGWLYAAGALVALALVWRGGRKGSLIVCAAVLAVSFAVMDVALPAAGIPKGSVKEVLSVPFQQTARCLLLHPDDVTDEEREAIDRVLRSDVLAQRYNPALSDPVKNTFDRASDRGDLAAYLGAWASMGTRHPLTYAESVMASYYGYFYLSQTEQSRYTRATAADAMGRLDGDGFGFHPAENGLTRAAGDVAEGWRLFVCGTPVLRLTMASCLYSWALLVLTAFCARRRARWTAPALAAMWLVFLVCLIGPTGGSNYQRYIYPVALALAFAVPAAFGTAPPSCRSASTGSSRRR